FYTIVMVPFVVLALTYCLTLLWGRARASAPPGAHRRRFGLRVSGALVARRLTVGLILAAAVIAFAYFWPVYTGEVIPFSDWNDRMWTITWRGSAVPARETARSVTASPSKGRLGDMARSPRGNTASLASNHCE